MPATGALVNGGVAQQERAPGRQPGGREFKSRRHRPAVAIRQGGSAGSRRRSPDRLRVRVPDSRRVKRVTKRPCRIVRPVKRCSKCGIEKPKDQYHSRIKRGKLYVFPHCIECHRKIMRAHYDANRQKYLDKAARFRAAATAEARDFIWNYLNAHPCTDCGETDPLVSSSITAAARSLTTSAISYAEATRWTRFGGRSPSAMSCVATATHDAPLAGQAGGCLPS
jgi:hypothetical protein